MALRCSTTLTGGGLVDPSLTLTQAEEHVATLIGSSSISGIGGGGDIDAPPVTESDNGKHVIAHRLLILFVAYIKRITRLQSF